MRYADERMRTYVLLQARHDEGALYRKTDAGFYTDNM